MDVGKLMNGSSLAKQSMNQQHITKHIRHQDGNYPELRNERELIDKQEVETVVSQLNGFIDPTRTNLKFTLHEELNEYYVAIVNPITNEVLKEIPPKKMLDMYAAMTQFLGVLIDEKI